MTVPLGVVTFAGAGADAREGRGLGAEAVEESVTEGAAEAISTGAGITAVAGSAEGG